MTPAQLFEQRENVGIIDIRKNPEDKQIPGSERYSSEEMETAEEPPFATGDRVVLYCGSGNSCGRVARALRDRGYSGTQALVGGYAAWVSAGFPLEER